MKIKNFVAIGIIAVFLVIAGLAYTFFSLSASLPRMITLEDYKPLVVSQMFSRDGQKVGEFFREKRIVMPYSKIPKQLVYAFISAEDSHFFEHGGLNFSAIARAILADIKAGHSAQGGSTITQQVAKSLMLTPEKKLSRKIKEAILAFRMEKHLKKEDILYLYLNQIYLGHGAYGVEAAAENYFRKHVEDLTIAECAMLAGLPQAPGKYSPLLNPIRAKERQLYVLNRMADENHITHEQAKIAGQEVLKVYYKEEFEDLAPFFKETVRQFLVEELGEEKVLDEGIRIYTGMDVKKQLAAQDSVMKNLRDLDKRQGFRGVKKNLPKAEDIAAFLLKERDELIGKTQPYKLIAVSTKEVPHAPLDLAKKAKNLPDYLKVGQIVEGVVTKVDSKQGLVTVRVAEAQGLIDIDDMNWARKIDPTRHWTEAQIHDPAKALSSGDIIEVKIKSEKYTSDRLTKLATAPAKGKKPAKAAPLDPSLAEYIGLSLEQEPTVEGALLSFDLNTQDVLAMVGGTDFERSEYNRALQAARQTGSVFKSITYAAALDKGYQANSVIVDAPIIYEEGEGQEIKKWKPGNFENKFSGDVLFRNALIKSLNIPTVKITEKMGVEWVAKYARRLGIFSPLNPDFTMTLGSSSITLYEMTKALSTYPRGGKRIHPLLIRKVTDFSGQNVLIENVSLDKKFEKELNKLEVEFHPELAKELGIELDPKQQAKLDAKLAALANPVAAKSPVEKANAVVAASGQSPSPEIMAAVNLNPNAPFEFADREQLISPQTAYLITHLMKGVVLEGTGFRAKAINRPSGGKTGTTSGYFDAWYIGFTPQVSTGVWVGYDDEKPLGRLETGNSAALPIWVDYMMTAVADTPALDFPVPTGIVFANIDAETGKLASVKSKKAVREAFREGTEPTSSSTESTPSEEKNFFKEDLSD